MITYEKLDGDTPVMYIEESNLLSKTAAKIFTITGEKAEQLYKELTGQNQGRKRG